jgi:hypothetical protein
MRRITFVFSILSLALQLQLAVAQSAPKPAVESPVSQVEGAWRLTPLVAKGAAVPDTNGQFQEFGETYAMDNMLVFWARFGMDDKDWGLFSLKDGKISKVVSEGVDFVAPDSRKLRLERPTPFFNHTRFDAGKRMLYISSDMPQHVYGWDGERLVRVLCAGDPLEVNGVRYTIKKATVLDIGPDGRALIYYDANKPQHMNGWVLHDGTSFKPLWKEGDPLPGMPGVQIKNLSAGPSCMAYCVGAPKLLEDGSVLAALEVTGDSEKVALFRLSPGKTEKINVEITSEFFMPGEHRGLAKRRIGELLMARSDSFITDVSIGATSATPGTTYITRNYYLAPRLLFYHQGKAQIVSKVGGREEGVVPTHDLEYLFHSGMYLTPDSPRLVFAVTSTSTQDVGKWVKKHVFYDFPRLYFWDGEELTDIPWEAALQMDKKKAVETLQSKPVGYYTMLRPKAIALRRITRPVSGVGVLLPADGPDGSRWFIPSDSSDGKLQRAPRFRVADRTVTVADVLAWNTPEEAVVGLEDGYFLLTKAADVK